ncbi:Unknown protein [Striga hermonthica]|uniref:Transposase-associated domain-containing protein n=1 Tax=Striga hermonthica TaxID=68872 RepID=A0A9N7MT50_STRHE|nr:Unknown protein [Striga hermonthica]
MAVGEEESTLSVISSAGCGAAKIATCGVASCCGRREEDTVLATVGDGGGAAEGSGTKQSSPEHCPQLPNPLSLRPVDFLLSLSSPLSVITPVASTQSSLFTTVSSSQSSRPSHSSASTPSPHRRSLPQKLRLLRLDVLPPKSTPLSDSNESGDKIRCPCRKCNNVLYQSRDDVEADLLENGIVKHYTKWEFHGEESDESDDDAFDFEEEENNVECDLDETERGGIGGNLADYVDMQSVLEDCYTATRTNAWGGDQSTMDENAVPQWESEKFMRLLRDVDKELYPGCKNFTKLSFVVTLMHLKIVGRWSNKSFSMLLELLKKALPSGEVLPQSYYEAKKIIRDLGLDYEKIHACVNDCVLFRKEHEKAV